MIDKDDLPILAAVFLFVMIVIVVGVWFAYSHECVRSHQEQRMSCTTVGTNVGGGMVIGSTDCRPYVASVCDEWVRR